MWSKYIYLLLSLVLGSCTTAYNKRFIGRIESKENAALLDSAYSPSSIRLDLSNFDGTKVSSILFSEINKIRGKKNRPEFHQDSLYNAVAQTMASDMDCREDVRTNRYGKNKRALRYVFQMKQSHYKAFQILLVEMDLLDLSNSKSFYFNSQYGISPLNYYEGRKPDPGDTAEINPIPVFPVTESGLVEKFRLENYSGQLARAILDPNFEIVAIAASLVKRTLRKHMRPKMAVIFLFGGKRMQKVKVPKEVKNGFYNHIP